MKDTKQVTGEGKAPHNYSHLSPSDQAFNRALDRVEAFLDAYFVTPLLGKAPEKANGSMAGEFYAAYGEAVD